MVSGCGITDWADKHMPVIGQRCENWQCVTPAGQAASDAKTKQQANTSGNLPAQDNMARQPIQ
jgi:hypothetical protein